MEKPKKNVQYMDKDLEGFFLEYRKTGVGTWYFSYKSPSTGAKSYFRMGSTKDMNAVVAREKAYRIHFLIIDGNEPKEKLHISQKLLVSEMYKSKNINKQNTLIIQGNKNKKSKYNIQMTMEKFIYEKYLPYIQSIKKSWHIDKQTFDKDFLPVFGQHSIDAISKDKLLVWLDTFVQRGLAQNTCNRILATIKSLFNYAVKWHILDLIDNPCLFIPSFPKHVPVPRFLNKHEIKNVLQSLQSMKMIGAKALQLLILTGAKKSEIMTARWEYVDFEARTIIIPADKFNDVRFIPLSDEALQILEELYQEKSSIWLFPSNNPSKHITSLFYVWNSVRKENGLNDVRIQDLRHSFGSMLMSSGASLHEVQKILGHSDPKSTMRYAHFAKGSLLDTANRMSGCLR